MPIKFLLDENISKSTVDFLVSSGYDVKSVHDLKLTGADDVEILRKAALSSRIIITHDLDFGNLISYPVHYSGVIILRLKDQTPKNTNNVLDKFLKKIDKKILIKSLAIVSEYKFRIRTLEK